MKLVNINKNGTLKFRLKPIVKKVYYNGEPVRESVVKHVYSYNSGYVRIEGNDRLYQINKVIKIKPNTKGNYFEMYERVLLKNPQERYKYLVEWVERFYQRNTVTI
tara:strand:+ start:241 stop:558 length:318 start_codon:yes stop_codon:yes gene_type:complete